MKYLNLLIFLGCSVTALASPILTNGEQLNFVSFSVPQKLALFALSIVQPEKFGTVLWSSLFSEEELLSVDNFFVDLRTLLTQAIKLEDEIPFPEIDWVGSYDPCLPVCDYYNLTFDLKTGNTTIRGQQDTTSVNGVTPTTFRNLFTVLSVVLESPDFILDFFDGRSDIGFIWKNVLISLSDLKFETSFDYEFVRDLGIQIRNLDIEFGIGHLHAVPSDVCEYWADVPDYCHPLDPLVADFTPYLIDGWLTQETEYENSLEFQINCLLSEARVDPEGCRNPSGNATEMYQKMNVIQLFQTIGLGALESS